MRGVAMEVTVEIVGGKVLMCSMVSVSTLKTLRCIIRESAFRKLAEGEGERTDESIY